MCFCFGPRLDSLLLVCAVLLTPGSDVLGWKRNTVEVVKADDRPFAMDSNVVEARYYDDSLGQVRGV